MTDTIPLDQLDDPGPDPPHDIPTHTLDQYEAAHRATNTNGRTASNGAARRVPPHNLHAEESLLGACLYSPRAVTDTADLLTPTDFYKPAHGHIWHAILTLTANGAPIDPVTVHDQLGGLAQPDGPTSRAGLDSLLIATPTTTNAARYATIIAEHAQLRRLITTTTDLTDQAYNHPDDPHTLITRALDQLTQLHTTDTTDTTDTTWAPIDLTPILNGDHTPPTPTICHLDDGQALFYPARINAINAESESGKSWLAFHAATQQLAAGNNVTIIDFEDDAAGVTGRLLDLGATPTNINTHLTYLRPDDAFDHPAAARLTKHLDDTNPTLVVLDGVTEALAQNGWKINDNDDAATFAHRILRPIARTGAAVLLIDHVTKDRENQGQHAIGAQHKRAMISGASYKLEVIEPFGKGRTGRARIIVTKDRPGAVRGTAIGGRNVGTMQLGSPLNGPAHIVLRHFTDDPEHPTTFRPTALMEKISRAVEDLNAANEQPTQAAILRDVGGKKTHVVTALRLLIAEGHLDTEPGPKRATEHVLKRPYHQRHDPLSDRYEPDQEDPDDPMF